MSELREYQWYQSAWSQGEARLKAEKVRTQTEEQRGWAEDLEREANVRYEQAETAAERLLEAMAKADLYGSEEAAESWAAHEKAWEGFEASMEVAEPLRYEDVPWPPATSGLLSAMAAAEIARVKGESVAGSRASDSREAFVAHKRAFRKANLRWHPDKFMHRFGKALDARDAARIEARTQEISQAINEAWSTISDDRDRT